MPCLDFGKLDLPEATCLRYIFNDKKSRSISTDVNSSNFSEKNIYIPLMQKSSANSASEVKNKKTLSL